MSDMPRPRPPHLQKRISRHGKTVWYVRMGRGPLIRIKGAYGSPEFETAYQAAVHGEKVATERSPSRDTLGWLVRLYMVSRVWLDLKPSTRERRLPTIRAVLKTSASYPLSTVTTQSLIAGRDKRTAPSQARIFIMTMKSIFKWAVNDARIIATDPAASINVGVIKTEGWTPWSIEDIRQYEARWPRGTAERVMLDIYTYTGLRRGDAARVGRQHVKNGEITIVTEKSGMTVTIPILPELADTLAAGPIGDMSFNVGRYGRPLTARGLGRKFGEACRLAGLVGRSAHGLRKAAAIRAIENGATQGELDATFGWVDGGQTSRTYTKKPNRAVLSRRGISKLERNEEKTSLLPPQDSVVAQTSKPQRKQR
jgi:integrase